MKEWWKDFFGPLAGEIMFTPKAKVSKNEVEQVIKRTKTPKRARVLDLACGIGRHSIEFAKKGFEVTGLDYSKPYIASAKRSASQEKVKVQFVKGDMKNLRPHFASENFDLVVSLYNSFGYFKSRKDDFRMLQEVHRVLKPGGKFVLNTLNGEGVKKRLKNPISMGREPIKKVFMIDSAKFDEKKAQTQAEWTIVDARKSKAKIHRLKFHQNVYTNPQLKALLRKAGFTIETTWGLLHGEAFDRKKSWHQTIVARK